MRYFFIMILCTVPMFSEIASAPVAPDNGITEYSDEESPSDRIYLALEGVWESPSEGELAVFFSFDSHGNFNTSILPAFEYKDLTQEQQNAVIKENVSSTEGYFEVLEFLHETKSMFSAVLEILLNDEVSTNTVEITDTEIYLINSDQQKILFAQKKS